jgi:hypothetical protein
LNDAPGGLDDAAFDALFPADGVSNAPAAPQVQQTETPAVPTQVAPPVVQTQTPEDVFIKGDKTVYKTREAAIEGLNNKDSLIDTLRQRYALATGIDPITGQPMQASAPQVAPVQVNYSENPEQYMNDLIKAGELGPKAIAQVQQKFIRDTVGQNVVQAANDIARTKAINTVNADIKDFGTFIGTDGYNKALDVVPELKNAIATAESDAQFSGQLPGLYKAAYLIGKGLQVPQAIAAANQLQNQPPSRPAVSPSQTPRTATITPVSGTKASFGTLAGIRAIIAEHEAKGTSLDF